LQVFIFAVKNYFKYIYYFNNEGFRNPVTIMTKQLAVTANHCIPSDKEQGDSMQIFDHEGQTYRVTIILQNKENDFAILRLFPKEFPIEPLPIEPPSVGTSYFALVSHHYFMGDLFPKFKGYPTEYGTNTKHQFVESAIKGVIMSPTLQANNCVYGDSGGSPGFSGGPVISLTYPRGLLGIVLGGRKMPQLNCTDSSVPKILAFCTETPRVKILPGIFYLVN
jgi:hypothetical protein